MCLKYVLVGFTPPSLSLFSPHLFLAQFQQVSFFSFHIQVQNTPTIFTLILPFLMSIPLPLVPIPTKDLFFPPSLQFLIKFILIVQGGFALVHPVWIYCAFIKLTLPLLTYSLSPCSPNIQ
jgi:hypothetical protein